MKSPKYQTGDKVMIQLYGPENGESKHPALITKVSHLWGQTIVYYVDVVFGTEPVTHGLVYEHEVVGYQNGQDV